MEWSPLPSALVRRYSWVTCGSLTAPMLTFYFGTCYSTTQRPKIASWSCAVCRVLRTCVNSLPVAVAVISIVEKLDHAFVFLWATLYFVLVYRFFIHSVLGFPLLFYQKQVWRSTIIAFQYLWRNWNSFNLTVDWIINKGFSCWVPPIGSFSIRKNVPYSWLAAFNSVEN